MARSTRIFIGIIVGAGLAVFGFSLYYYPLLPSKVQAPPAGRVEQASLGGGTHIQDDALVSIRERPSVRISDSTPKQSDTLLIRVLNAEFADVEGTFDGRDIGFFTMTGEREIFGLVGIGVKQEPGIYELAVRIKGADPFVRSIEVVRRLFPITELVVTEELESQGYTPENITTGIVVDENALVREATRTWTPFAYFSEPFTYPLEKVAVVGEYGNIRKSGPSELQHLGVDLEASLGTPVYAVNNGMVRFVRELRHYGKTMIIDHGIGIYSLYLHLDSFEKKEGDQVVRGEKIAESGNTGYSIDPHLHFSMKIDSESVGPLRFIEATHDLSSFAP